MSERCILYIDGYNFYYAIKKHPGMTPLYLGWCDFGTLARRFMLAKDASLVGIRYFTAPVGSLGAVTGPAGGEAGRQRIWLDAVSTIPGLEIVSGYHRGKDPGSRKEKQTDVNLAVAVVTDAARDRLDRAIILTGDLDQEATVRAAADFGKRVEIWLSPSQEVRAWTEVAAQTGAVVRKLTPDMLLESRLPERWTSKGHVMEAPRIWKAPGR
jgi:uncharacterized LabA/DUF88 family protein